MLAHNGGQAMSALSNFIVAVYKIHIHQMIFFFIIAFLAVGSSHAWIFHQPVQNNSIVPVVNHIVETKHMPFLF